MRRATRATAVFIAVVLICGLVSAEVKNPHERARRLVRPNTPGGTARTLAAPTTTTSTTTTSTTTSTSTTTTEAPAPPEPTTTVAPAPAGGTAAVTAQGTWAIDPYVGLGTWVDVYDWTAQLGGSQISNGSIDDMAAHGVQTLYLQPVRWDIASDLMETDRLLPLLARAHADGMRVVAWYLPDLRDIGNDFRHLQAIAQSLPIDGLAIDIESRTVSDVGLRNQQLLALSGQLRGLLPGQLLGAIVLPPVVLDDINPAYWPSYPWTALAGVYGAWLPMSYFTNRTGTWRDARAYTAENVARVRAHTGILNAPVHTIGGIADKTTATDVAGMVAACADQGCIGGGLYDYLTTGDPSLWAGLQPFRR